MAHQLDYQSPLPSVPKWAAAAIVLCVYVVPIFCGASLVCDIVLVATMLPRSERLFGVLIVISMIAATAGSWIGGVLAVILHFHGYKKYLNSYILDWFLAFAFGFWWWWCLSL